MSDEHMRLLVLFKMYSKGPKYHDCAWQSVHETVSAVRLRSCRHKRGKTNLACDWFSEPHASHACNVHVYYLLICQQQYCHYQMLVHAVKEG